LTATGDEEQVRRVTSSFTIDSSAVDTTSVREDVTFVIRRTVKKRSQHDEAGSNQNPEKKVYEKQK
jgi:hypothetical protein